MSVQPWLTFILLCQIFWKMSMVSSLVLSTFLGERYIHIHKTKLGVCQSPNRTFYINHLWTFCRLLSPQSIHITNWKLLLLESWERQGFIFKLPTSYVRLYFPSEWTIWYNCPLLYHPPQSVRLLFSHYTFTFCLSIWRWKYEIKIYSLQSQYSDKECKLGVFCPWRTKVQKGSEHIRLKPEILLVGLHLIHD